MTAWDLNRAALRQHLETDKLEDFLRWSTVEKTMFVGDVGFVRKEYEELMKLPSNIEIYPALSEIENGLVGNPKLLWGWTSGNLIHQLYHLKQWLDRSGKTVDQLQSIVEVGAGYGAMALICQRLGFNGWYHIEDLPELKVVQGYYLHNTVGLDNVTWSLPEKCDLFIACHSLSEMPVDERERLMSTVQADAYLFASSYEFEGVDNATWLQQFAGGTVGYEVPGRYDWTQWAHPHQENAFYQVGVRV